MSESVAQFSTKHPGPKSSAADSYPAGLFPVIIASGGSRSTAWEEHAATSSCISSGAAWKPQAGSLRIRGYPVPTSLASSIRFPPNKVLHSRAVVAIVPLRTEASYWGAAQTAALQRSGARVRLAATRPEPGSSKSRLNSENLLTGNKVSRVKARCRFSKADRPPCHGEYVVLLPVKHSEANKYAENFSVGNSAAGQNAPVP